MRIDELRKEVESLGRLYNVNLRVREELIYIFIDRCDGEMCNTLALLGTKQTHIINVDWFRFVDLPYGFKDGLLNIFVKFVRTPVDEREEEKRFQYRLKEKYWWIADKFHEEKTYLNFRTARDTFIDISLENKEETDFHKTKFTDEEIGVMVEEYDIDLDMFDKIEVL